MLDDLLSSDVHRELVSSADDLEVHGEFDILFECGEVLDLGEPVSLTNSYMCMCTT